MADSAMPGPKLAGFSTRIFGLRIANSGCEFDADATFKRDRSVIHSFRFRSDQSSQPLAAKSAPARLSSYSGWWENITGPNDSTRSSNAARVAATSENNG